MKDKRKLLETLATAGRTLLLLVVLCGPVAAQAVVATVPVGGRLDTIAVNSSTNRIYVISCSGCPPVLTVIDGNNNSVLTSVELPFDTAGLAVNPSTNLIYTNRWVIDGATNTVFGPMHIGDAGVLAVNPQTNRLYDNIGRVLDLANNTVIAGIPVQFGGQYPEDVAVDSAANRIYMAGNGFLHVIDGSMNTIIETITTDIGGVPRVTVNSATHRVYLSGNTASGQVKMLVFDGSTDALVTTIQNVLPFFDLDVNEQTNRIYGVNIAFRQLWIFDGDTNTVASRIGVGSGARAVAANSQTAAVYTADEQAGTVTVVQDISPHADLAITNSASPNPVVTGSDITYTITVTNNGPGIAQGVTMTDNLPASTSLVSCSSTGSGVCGGTGNNRTVTFSSLGAGASETINIVVTVSCAVANGAVFTNTAAVSSSTSDPATSNSSFTVTTTASNPPPAIACPADITTPTAPGHCSAPVNYSVTASDNCTSVTVSCNPPSGSSFQKGIHTVLCTAIDSGGASSDCTFTVTVMDMEAPTITCPANITLTSDSGQCFATFNPGTATATDNCSGVIVSGARNDGRSLTDSYPVGTTAIIWTATDSAGNQAYCFETVTVNAPQLTALGPARVWIGLKNSDDVGTKFDLLAEVFKDGTLVGSGQLDNVPGGSSGFNNAVLRMIDLALSAPVDMCSGDTLSIRLSVRIAIGATGHRSGTARLWFNDPAANSRFDATIGGGTNDNFLLDGFTLGGGAGPGPKKTIDVFVDRAVGGNPFKPFGTWTKTL